MSEEEILKEIDIIKTTIEDILQIDIDNYIEDIYKIDTRQYEAIQGLLDLYNKEKEKNKELFLQYEKEVDKLEYQITTMISKNKIREKIEELEHEIETNSLYEENWNKIEVLKELLKEE